MILYFDSYITDIPLSANTVSANDYLREGCTNYRMPSKVDIARYTLASYSQYNWSHVLIRYEVDNEADYHILDEYILNLFPKATILHKRSSSFKDFNESLKIINKFHDEWVFYAGNNDHPWIGASAAYVNELINVANKFINKYQYISILYTHYVEGLNLRIKNSPTNLHYGRDVIDLEENEVSHVILRKQGNNTGAQIVNKKLLNYWFSTTEFPNERVVRSEDVRKLFITSDQLVVIPKREICAHFDGMPHTIGTSLEIASYQIPPLFIPYGFFTENIKIAYGYDEYRDGWVNINPSKKNYIFNNKNGTDLKIGIDDIPFFWKEKIVEIDVNNNIDESLFSNSIKYNRMIEKTPWNILNKNFSFNTFLFALKYLWIFLVVRSSLIKITHNLNERRYYVKKIYTFLRALKNNL